jgi:hypothetical protein
MRSRVRESTRCAPQRPVGLRGHPPKRLRLRALLYRYPTCHAGRQLKLCGAATLGASGLLEPSAIVADSTSSNPIDLTLKLRAVGNMRPKGDCSPLSGLVSVGMPIDFNKEFGTDADQKRWRGDVLWRITPTQLEALDAANHTVAFRRSDGTIAVVTLRSPQMQSFAETLKPGDKVDVTYTESIAVNLIPEPLREANTPAGAEAR